MSFEDDLKKLGDDVSNLVDNAINSQNFQQLNQKITDSINQLVYPRKNGAHPDTPPGEGPYQQQERRYRKTGSENRGPYSGTGQDSYRHTGQNSYRRTERNSYTRTEPRSYTRTSPDSYSRRSGSPQNHGEYQPQRYQWQPPSRMLRRHLFISTVDAAFLGGFQTTIGATLAVIFGFSSLSILAALFSGSFNSSIAGAVFSLLICLLPTAAGGYLIYRGKTNRRLCRHFRLSQNFIGPRDYITIEELSERLGLSREDTLDEVHAMLEKRMFRQGHLDRQETCLMITDQMYQKYLDLEKEQAARQREEMEREQELAEKGLSPEYLEMVKECETYLSNIHQCACDLSGAAIASKIQRLELVVSRILEAVKKQPKKAQDLQKFMNYYMPTTWKLLDSYRNFEKEPIQSENILKTKKEIEETLDTINNAFETLLNDLFQSTAWDISSDISVLETMLAQEGLTGNKMKF